MKWCEVCGAKASESFSYDRIPLCVQCYIDAELEAKRREEQGRRVNIRSIVRDLLRERNCAGDYLLRDTPRDLWDSARHWAVDNNISLRSMILLSLREFLAKDR